MVASQGFLNSIQKHLNTKLCDLEDLSSLFDSSIQVFDNTTPLQKVLQNLSTACLVYFEDKVPDHQKQFQCLPEENVPSTLDSFSEHHVFMNSCDLASYIITNHNIASTQESLQQFFNLYKTPIGTVANQAEKYNYTCLTDESSCSSLLSAFRTAYYVPILSHSAPHRLYGVSTIFKLLQFIHSSSDFCPVQTNCNDSALDTLHLFTASDINDLKLSSNHQSGSSTAPQLQTCYEDASIAQVLKIIHENKVSAVPVMNHVDPTQCITIFSVTDLRLFLIYFDKIRDSAINIHPFQTQVLDILSQLYQLHSLKARHPMIHCKMNTSINATVNKMLAVSIRHLLLADSTDRIVNILTLRDIAKYLIALILR